MFNHWCAVMPIRHLVLVGFEHMKSWHCSITWSSFMFIATNISQMPFYVYWKVELRHIMLTCSLGISFCCSISITWPMAMDNFFSKWEFPVPITSIKPSRLVVSFSNFESMISPNGTNDMDWVGDEMPLTKGPQQEQWLGGYKRNGPPMHIQGPRWTLHGPRKMWRPSLKLFVCKY